jgi:hypothetical protein
MGGSQKTGAKFNKIQQDFAKKQSAKAGKGTKVDPGGVPRKTKSAGRKEDGKAWEAHGPIPKAQGVGTVIIGAFIETKKAGAAWQMSAGDDRGFDYSRTRLESRFSIVADFDTGVVHVRVAPSCLGFDHTDCIDAEPGGITLEHVLVTDPPAHMDGQEGFRIQFSKSNPAIGLAPTLDLGVVVAPTGDGHVYVTVLGDAYPSIEAYRIDPGGGLSTIGQSHGFASSLPEGAAALIVPGDRMGFLRMRAIG